MQEHEKTEAEKKQVPLPMTGNNWAAHRRSASWLANYECNTEGMSADEKLKRWQRDGV